jgi:pimeloyl-ACP methyl ester carboxylesterase
VYTLRRPPRHEGLTLRGLAHRVSWWGPPSASPIVLLHGFQDAADTYQFVVDELPAHWSFVGLDWRGFGGSAWQPDGYWFPDYLADLEALLAQVTPAHPARIVGHSMGGNVAALYGGIRPDRVARIVNIEGFGLPRTTPDEAPARFARWLDELARAPIERGYASSAELAQRLAARNPRLTRDRAEFIAQSWTRERNGRVELASDPRHRLVNPVLYRRDENEACWRRCVAPVLLLLGEHSEFRGRLGADAADDYFSQVFPQLTLRTLDGVGHMMHHEDPARVAREIEAFFA